MGFGRGCRSLSAVMIETPKACRHRGLSRDARRVLRGADMSDPDGNFGFWCIEGYFGRDEALVFSEPVPTRVPSPDGRGQTRIVPCECDGPTRCRRSCRVRERLEPSHRRTASLDRPMILLDDVV